ncbi:hypothetical protein [Stenotrophomonas sp. VV52]|uniref:hypothetical protein n=1 Tax=Stenotrophomonas sp. VV52 TaxID=2066958 RepID=UPI000C9DEBC2|nr:hypothetical protein [Stenotrophomonas sp. VV52]
MAIAWSDRKHLPEGDAAASYETRAAAHPCNDLATLQSSVELQALKACEGLPDSADMTVTHTFTGCFASKSIQDVTITVAYGAVSCGNLRSSLRGHQEP